MLIVCHMYRILSHVNCLSHVPDIKSCSNNDNDIGENYVECYNIKLSRQKLLAEHQKGIYQ